jgi:uncharacterized protein YeaO (DUF488 family)
VLRIVRLGSSRARGEGLRIGAVRFPPRGVPKGEVAKRDLYDLWFPLLAPSAELIAGFRAGDISEAQFFRRYRAEMKERAAAQSLELLAALSRQTNLSIGCYCEDEAHCHRHVLRELLTRLEADVR